MVDSNAIERVAAYSAPMRLQVEEDSSLEERHWIVRFTADLPSETELACLESTAREGAIKAVGEARSTRGLDTTVDASRVELRVHRVDARHLIVSIRTIRLEMDDAHAWLVAASAAMRSLHDSLPVDEIQGFPRAFWKIIVGN